MSGKKQNQPIWYDCSKCGQRLIRIFTSKHNELNCGTIFPVIENGILVTTLSKVSSASKIGKLPFINSHLGSSTIFLSEAIIRECGFETFNWVLVTKIVSSSDSEETVETSVVGQNNYSNVPTALRVWAIPEQQISHSNPHAIMTGEGLFLNCHMSTSERYSIQKPNTLTLPSANYVEIHVKSDLQIDGTRFCQNIKRLLRNRIITSGNCFQARYYTELVTFTVKVRDLLKVVEIDDALCREMKDLSCDDHDDISRERQYKFFEVVHQTEFHFVNRQKNDNNIESRAIDQQYHFTTLDNVGGMEECIKDITSSIQYTLSSPNSASNGILIHGQQGTGKSLLLHAVCNSLKFNAIVFHEILMAEELKRPLFLSEHSASTLEQAFRLALASQPSVIVIENIEILASSNTNSRTAGLSSFNSNFSGTLRTMMPSLIKSKVIVLATCSNVDLLDSTLRSPHIFGKEIETPVPSPIQREDICYKILKRMTHCLTGEEVKIIASTTHGFVGADLQGLFSQASITCAQENMAKTFKTNEFDLESISSFSMLHVQQAMRTVRPSAMKSILIDVPNVKWDDIGGQTELKFKLKQTIEWPLKHPEAFQRLGITAPKGILMYGPPGCSKTMIAKAIATESGLNFISVKGSELFSKWVGESEKAVQKIFRKARQVAPCIVFFDEIDSLGGERGSSSGASNVHERVLAQLLIEIDGIEPLKEVTIVAATNRPDIIDQALLRPGRLDRIIYVPLPDLEAREEIFKIWFRKMPVDSNVNIEGLAKLTEGYSGAEITAVCHEAALHALDESIEASIVADSHFSEALKTVRPRISKEQLLFYENYSESCKLK